MAMKGCESKLDRNDVPSHFLIRFGDSSLVDFEISLSLMVIPLNITSIFEA